MKLLIASGNKNKFREIQDKFDRLESLTLVPLGDIKGAPDVIEDGLTFEDNAVKKARELFEFTRMPVLADDSGLEVLSLDGRPGVYSARYGNLNSDAERNRYLLEEMHRAGVTDRSARFVCVIAIADQSGTIHTARGECKGVITESPSGANGFGYDPVFFIPGLNKTMAELTLDEKNTLSHRARALEKSVRIIQSIIGHE